MSYLVIQRTKEIGIRMAIGAERADVLRMILREATVLTVAGLVIGTGLALGSAQAAKSLLFGLKPRDPLTLVMAVVTSPPSPRSPVSCRPIVPPKLDPLTALRYE
jgi:ABC-type antimicrobial peptide transport system permease subunit